MLGRAPAAYPVDRAGLKALRDATRPFRKLLLTATPLQNSLLELYGLVSVIDEQFFSDEAAFRAAYMLGSGAAACSARSLCGRRRMISVYPVFIHVCNSLRSGTRHCERSEAISCRLRSGHRDCFVALRAPRNDIPGSGLLTCKSNIASTF